MKAAIFLVFLFLLFCFLIGVSYVFWKLKKFLHGNPAPTPTTAPAAQAVKPPAPPPPTIPAVAPSTPPADPIAQTMQKLAQANALLRQGALTQDEFNQLKKTILTAARESVIPSAHP